MREALRRQYLPEWYDTFLSELSLSRVMDDVVWIVENTPHRLSGTEGAERTAEYLAYRLAEAGIEVNTDRVPGYLSIPGDATVEVVHPVARRVEARPFAHSGSTGPDGVEGELVYLGAGADRDYESVDVRGKVVLVELSYSPPRPEKVRLAMAHGAVAVIMMNWGEDTSTVFPYGTCKPVWGNPRAEDMVRMPTLPALGVSRQDGMALRRLLEQGTVRVRVSSTASRGWYDMSQPRGVIRAADPQEETPDFLILCGHMDSWPFGATDNATGNAVALEIARGLQKVRYRLRRDVWILFWQGHENGIMAGSTWFVDHYWDHLRRRAIGHINIDSPGMEGTSVWRANSTAELVTFHRAVEELLIPERQRVRGRVPRTGDQSFFGVGIPSLTARTVHTEEQIRAWHGATLGWWYHSEEDTLERVDQDLLGVALRVIGAYALGLTTSPVLPYDFVPAARETLERLEEVAEILADRPAIRETLDLDRAREAARGLLAVAEELEGVRARVGGNLSAQEVRRWNEVLKTATRRLIHAKHSVAGVYGQDPYGLSATASELPGLYPVRQLAALEEGSHEAHLVYTEVRRQRNRIVDALEETGAALRSVVAEQ